MRRTHIRTIGNVLSAVTLALVVAVPVAAEVVRVDVVRRSDVGTSGYEKIVGTIHFALDPANAHNAVIVDLDKAPLGSGRRVELSADVYVLRPKDASRANGVALIEVSNRGNKGMLALFNRTGRGDLDFSADADLGDGFLMQQGYTVVWVGWQFDVDRAGGRMKLDPPMTQGITEIVRANFVLDQRSDSTTVTDLVGYTLDGDGPDAALTVRDGLYGEPSAVPRSKWNLRGHRLTLQGGFEPGRTYEVAARASALPVAGTGLAAFRDTASWLKHDPSALAPVKFAYAFGSSQSGRFLRTFMYYGFNSDEQGRQAYDGVMAHIAGGARLSINERGARPNQSKAPTPAFPYADSAMRDPLSGRTDGLLDNDRARSNQPKVFYTNSAVEYWGADRLAALVHTTPDGKSDIAFPANVRSYFLTGTQHVPARFPGATSTGQQPTNPLEYSYTLRALLTAMDRWVKAGTLPPASQHPKLADGTLVRADRIEFPALPGVQSPRIVPGGREGTKPLPFLVPAVDADGNERAGVRTAEQAVPVATYTGWNFRSESIGAPHLLVSLMGSRIPFAKTAATKKSGDPRRSLEERYGSKEQYLTQAKAHCETLVQGGYLLATDVSQMMKRIGEQWDAVR